MPRWLNDAVLAQGMFPRSTLLHLQVSESAATPPTSSTMHSDQGREEGFDCNDNDIGTGNGNGNGNGKGGVAETETRGSSILPAGDGDARAGDGDSVAARLMRSTEAVRELGMACSV